MIFLMCNYENKRQVHGHCASLAGCCLYLHSALVNVLADHPDGTHTHTQTCPPSLAIKSADQNYTAELRSDLRVHS